MAILVGRNSRIIIQGITGGVGRNLASRFLDEGSPLVAGVSPRNPGGEVAGLPVYASCYEAVAKAGATASFISVPAPRMLDAALEAVDAGIGTIVAYAEGVPMLDALRMAAYARARGARLIGPNAAGCISPGEANLSDLNAALLRRGRIGVVSKSGTLTYEVIADLNRRGLGQSTVVCLGGDPVIGTSHRDVLELFERDDETDAIILIGEIGGRSELDAAEFIKTAGKPVIAYIAGRHAPPGKRMGHAGALMGAPDENVPGKQAALRAAGAWVVDSLFDIGAAAHRILSGREAEKPRVKV
ncbi:succinate--CoA ligase subunit alpha [Rhodoligotrophos defluvii]|uniref:succinate--CoA ligase subunit alpha n=1 Tax=Rhodoligotrophos defluvii TaxID=2561934 RepID=UPI0010C954CB|nr:succinate--CoA ligase subunit alpha [Rhodoligotrophos defluvii]